MKWRTCLYISQNFPLHHSGPCAEDREGGVGVARKDDFVKLHVGLRPQSFPFVESIGILDALNGDCDFVSGSFHRRDLVLEHD